MSERDRNQSNYGRNEGNYGQRDDSSYRGQSQQGHNQRDDRDDYRRAQGREQGQLGRDYNNERNLTGGRYGQDDHGARQHETQQHLPNVYGSYDDRFDRGQDAWRRSEYDLSYARDERERALQGSYNYNPNQNHERNRSYGFDRNRGFGNHSNEGAYGAEWNRGSTLQGYQQPQRDWGDRGYSQGNYERGYYSPQRAAGERSFAQRDWGNRAYGEGDHRGYGQHEQHGRDESWGQQLRDAGHEVAQKVKRVFRGPKGYKRSDERIREDVSDRLAHQNHLDPSEIEVAVANGEVTLTGTVDSRNEKFLAEEIADDVSGVNDVHNQIRLRREQPATQHQATNADNSTATANNQNANDQARARNARHA